MWTRSPGASPRNNLSARRPAARLLKEHSRTLAHTGTLFLDELPEFDRNALDALRQPLEEGVVTIARVHGRIQYPARFQLVAAMRPSRCGNYGTERECRCPAGEPERYVQRISGPLLDRFDMRIEMTRVPTEQLLGRRPGESSAVVGARIAAARALAVERNRGVANAELRGAALSRACALTPRSHRLSSGSSSSRRMSTSLWRPEIQTVA